MPDVTHPAQPSSSSSASDADQAQVLLAGQGWSPLSAKTAGASAVDGFLRDVLQAETLVVLTGLGTSLGITTPAGEAPTMRALLSAVEALPSYRAVKGQLSAKARSNVEVMLSEALLHAALDKGVEWTEFITAAEHTILEMCRFVEVTTSLPLHERLLRAISRRSPRLSRAQIFTTNYDLAFEVAASSTRTTVVDGFSWAGPPTFDGTWFDMDFVRALPDGRRVPETNVVHLLKLHGSVNWNRVGGRITRVHDDTTEPVLIYPSHDKYQLSYQQPYQELIARLQIALRQPGVGVLIVGYGFNDAHINAPIANAIRTNVNAKVAVVSPGLDTPAAGSFQEMMTRYIEEGDDRIALLAAKFKDLVEVLPTLEQDDDRDEHLSRVDRVDEQSTELP